MTIYGFLWRYFGWALSLGMIAGTLTLRGQDQSTDFTQFLGWGMLLLWGLTTLGRLSQRVDEARSYEARRQEPQSYQAYREPEPIAELEPAPDLRHDA